ncbi:MAG: GNAT family N-acetyltransferase [Anaerolineaceae bacterium]|nr:GNAT family N-acetyltransferase [Anaerolineaceae bacterium]
MRLTTIRDKKKLEKYLMRDPYLNALAIGDLDDFFWPNTTWYAFENEEGIERLALWYEGAGMPVLLFFEEGNDSLTQEFAKSLFPVLPENVYAHFRPGLDKIYQEFYDLDSHGLHHKMALLHSEYLDKIDSSGTVKCSMDDLPLLTELYTKAYSGNFFDPRMLETGQYYAIRENGMFISAAGIHVYSEKYGIAAIGNVTTLPDRRGEGLAKRVCARLSVELLKRVKYVTLNVKADNAPAIAVYEQLGFKWVADYTEYILRRKN